MINKLSHDFLVHFGINKHSKKKKRLQIALARILLAFEKFTRAYLFQIVLEIM